MSLIKKISYIGLSGNEESELRSRVILTNRLIFISLVMTISYVPLFILFEVKEIVVPAIIQIFLIATPFYFVKKKQYQLAAVLLVFYASCQVLYNGNVMIIGSAQLFLIPIFMFNLTLIKSGYIKALLGLIIISFFFFSEYYQYNYRINYPQEYSGEYLFTIITVVLVFATCFYTIFHFKVTNLRYEKEILKKNKMIEQQHQDLDRAHFDIKSSIQYAKRIQTAILPPRKLIKSHLKNSFILYEPKGLISGDFYWTEVYDDRILYAVADCTGHGVPGAMISVVCHNALNRAVREFNLLDPGEILEKTREIIIDKFQSVGSNLMDGMDIALVSMPLNEQVKEIKYAGANCPLYVIQKGNLKIYSADKQPIGQFHSPFTFSTKLISVSENDMIYIFTDGYVSQFGGDQGKKLKYKLFRNLLSSLEKHDIQTQSDKLIQYFEEWKGDYDQVDDICMIGVKI